MHASSKEPSSLTVGRVGLSILASPSSFGRRFFTSFLFNYVYGPTSIVVPTSRRPFLCFSWASQQVKSCVQIALQCPSLWSLYALIAVTAVSTASPRVQKVSPGSVTHHFAFLHVSRTSRPHHQLVAVLLSKCPYSCRIQSRRVQYKWCYVPSHRQDPPPDREHHHRWVHTCLYGLREVISHRVEYVDVNPYATTTILMVHGWPSLWSSWGRQIEHFKVCRTSLRINGCLSRVCFRTITV